MKKSTLAVERCKTVSTVQKILGGNGRLKSSIISPFGIFTASGNFAGISVTLRSQA